jgi:hypothetical protein
MDQDTSRTDAAAATRSVTYRMTPDEAYRVGRMLIPRRVPMAIGVGAALILLVGTVLVLSGQVGLGVLCLLWAIFVFASRPIVRWQSIRRISAKLAKVPEPVVVTIGPDGIRGARGQSSSLLSWADVTSVGMRGPFVWIQGRVNVAYAIPRRAFGSESDAQVFVTAANGFLAASTRA